MSHDWRKGITSVCSAQPDVIRTAFSVPAAPAVLIEATCNQVNQFGGYTGMTPQDFHEFIFKIARQSTFPEQKIILGGDHLGPNPWQNEPADQAMDKSAGMIQGFVQAGFTKLHIDCSMRLQDDPPGALAPATIARRAATLVAMAEKTAKQKYVDAQKVPLVYVIGTEVPVPGGTTATHETMHVSEVADVVETIDLHRQAFQALNLGAAWERVVAVVVQPGVEFGDASVDEYNPRRARQLSKFIESQPLVYEAHSTDYQQRSSLKKLVRDHFSILKVGPALTFAYREAIFSLAFMENELIQPAQRSNIISILEETMVSKPHSWEKYYSGNPQELEYKRKYSLSDRIRYYWTDPQVQKALKTLTENLSMKEIPDSLLSQFAPLERLALKEKDLPPTSTNVITEKIHAVLADYWYACGIPS